MDQLEANACEVVAAKAHDDSPGPSDAMFNRPRTRPKSIGGILSVPPRAAYDKHNANNFSPRHEDAKLWLMILRSGVEHVSPKLSLGIPA